MLVPYVDCSTLFQLYATPPKLQWIVQQSCIACNFEKYYNFDEMKLLSFCN